MTREFDTCVGACVETRKAVLAALRFYVERGVAAQFAPALGRLLDCLEACEACAEDCARAANQVVLAVA